MSYPYPEAFIANIRDLLGAETPVFFEALQRDPQTSIRLNPGKPGPQPALPKVPWCENGYYLPEKPLFTADPLFHAGAYYVQEGSSMFLEQVLKQLEMTRRSVRVLDLCAAPGGKSSHILSLISSGSLLVANEVIRSRTGILKENLIKWGYPNVVVTQNDPEDFRQVEGFFDLILVDAPCSGEGMFRKSESAIGEWSEEHVKLCSRRQRRILADIWNSLKPGGYLVYSTCTYNSIENEEQLGWLAEERGAEPVKLSLDAEWGITETFFNNMYGYRFYPHKTKGEGYFTGIVRKTGTDKNFRMKIRGTPPLPKKDIKPVESWFRNPEQLVFYANDLYIKAIPEPVNEECIYLMQRLNCHHSGILAAEQLHHKVKPSPWLANSICLDPTKLKTASCTWKEAVHYLRKDSLTLPAPATGYYLFSYKEVGIGWGNRIQNRWNNLFPREWRVRMDYAELERRKFSI